MTPILQRALIVSAKALSQLSPTLPKVDAARAGGSDSRPQRSHCSRGNSLRELLQSVARKQLTEEKHDVDEGALVAELDKMADDVESDDFYAD